MSLPQWPNKRPEEFDESGGTKPEEFAHAIVCLQWEGIIHAVTKRGTKSLEFLRAAIIVEKICKKCPDFKVDLALNTVLEPRGASDTDHSDEDKIKEIISASIDDIRKQFKNAIGIAVEQRHFRVISRCSTRKDMESQKETYRESWTSQLWLLKLSKEMVKLTKLTLTTWKQKNCLIYSPGNSKWLSTTETMRRISKNRLRVSLFEEQDCDTLKVLARFGANLILLMRLVRRPCTLQQLLEARKLRG